VVAGEVAFSFTNAAGYEEQVAGENGLCGPGGYFGERALMHNTPRACTVTTTKRTRVLMIDRDVFESLLGPLEAIMKQKEET
jgi:CRP-like cAMP-binding protein